MYLPKKGAIVSLEEIKELCIHFGLTSLWDKIANDPPSKPFRSDGCSSWPDKWKNDKGKKVNLYTECLKHDLQYWAGYKGEVITRFLADALLMVDVVIKTKRTKLALTMFLGVRVGGVSWLPTPFKWGFGRV